MTGLVHPKSSDFQSRVVAIFFVVYLSRGTVHRLLMEVYSNEDLI